MSTQGLRDVALRASALALMTLMPAVAPVALSGQQHLTVDQRTSLAWWQMNPHLNHLWATTCPEDPGYRPGEGVSVGDAGAFVKSLQTRFGFANIMDTIIPLYPRHSVRALCTPAVRGDVTVDDFAHPRQAKGTLAIN